MSRGDDVAEADASGGVEARVGLLVEQAVAVGVRRDEPGGEAGWGDGFGGEVGGC